MFSTCWKRSRQIIYNNTQKIQTCWCKFFRFPPSLVQPMLKGLKFTGYLDKTYIKQLLTTFNF